MGRHLARPPDFVITGVEFMQKALRQFLLSLLDALSGSNVVNISFITGLECVLGLELKYFYQLCNR